MKPTKVLITAVLTLLISMSVQAQSSDPDERWAGEDKVVLRLPDSTQTVTIGIQCKDADKCFSWAGPHMVSDSFQSVVTVNPQDSVSIYTVRRIDKCGEEIRQIKVTLADTVSLVSVTPLSCYNDGDSIKKEDFKIVTDPPGYEDLVTFSPIIAERHWGFITAVGSQKETFELKHNNHVSSKEVEVVVINDNLSASVEVGLDFKDLEKKVQDAEAMLQRCQQLVNGVNKMAGGLLCEPDFDHEFSKIGTPQYTCYCCNGKQVDAFNLIGPSLSGSVTVDCIFPYPGLGLPGGIGGVYINFGFTGGITLGPFTMRFRGECGQAEIPLELSAEIFGGVRLQAMSKKVLSASFLLVGSAKASWVWVIGKPTDSGWQGLNLGVSLRGEVTAFSLFTTKVNIPFGSWTVFK